MTLDHAREHALKNHLAIILGFAEVMRDECTAADPRAADIEEIYKAAAAAVALLAGAVEDAE